MALPQDDSYLHHAVIVGGGGLHQPLLETTQSGIKQLERHGHPIQGVQPVQNACDMQVPVLINHLGIILGHAF